VPRWSIQQETQQLHRHLNQCTLTVNPALLTVTAAMQPGIRRTQPGLYWDDYRTEEWRQYYRHIRLHGDGC